jgi:CubicO group peptidase (beta-lactamase class C family)
MNSFAWRRLLAALVATLALTACGAGLDSDQTEPRAEEGTTPAEPPDEGVILAQEIPHIVERAGLLSLPTDPTELPAILSTFPDQLGDVIAMHLGRLYPTPYELTPGVGPIVDLAKARADMLVSGQPQKLVEDTEDGEAAVVFLPVDATTVIVIMPTKVVRANAGAAPLPAAAEDLSQLTYEINGRTRTIEQYMQGGNTNAIAFMHNGKFIYDAYQNGFSTNTRQHMWSCTKSVTTSLVGIAVAEGLVDSIYDPIKKYIPEAADTDWEGTSIEDLLQMESGTYWVDVPVHQPEELILMGADYHSNGLYGMTRDQYLVKLTRVSPPGAFYRYNSGDAQMLAWLLERVYQKPYAEILSEKIWRPAGMQDDALVMHDRLGNTFASMGLFATARDMLRFGELHRSGGRSIDGKQIIPADWVRMSHNYDHATGGGDRGYMWASWGGVESGNYTAIGYGHQLVSVIPSQRTVGVRFGNDPSDSIAEKEFQAVQIAVGKYLAGR